MTAYSTRGRLSGEQMAHYREHGYLIYDRPLFTEAKFKRLVGHFEGLLERWTVEGRQSSEHMDTPHFRDPGLFQWLLDDQVLNLVESVIGPDIALFSSHFICKPPVVGKRVPWHEDSAYWGRRLEPMEVVTVWLAIDPATPDNRCMRVIPGTHHDSNSSYQDVDDPSRQVFRAEILPELIDESQAVDIILTPNHCSLHHAKLIHGSAANTGTMRRCGYTMRYTPTTVKHQTRPDFQIYLARGRDHAGNLSGDPSKPFEAR